MKLSVIIPAYNEQDTIYNILQHASSLELIQVIEKELLVVNHNSKMALRPKYSDSDTKTGK